MGPGETFTILALFSIPLSVIWTYHRRKILEIQLRLKQEGDTGVRASIEALRREMQEMKDTAMQYDLSFDSALQRMDQRVEGLERRVNEIGTHQTVRIGRGD